MGDVIWLLVIVGAVSVVAWVSYKAGYDAAMREADYTIANLRRSNRVLRSEVEVQTLRGNRRDAR